MIDDFKQVLAKFILRQNRQWFVAKIHENKAMQTLWHICDVENLQLNSSILKKEFSKSRKKDDKSFQIKWLCDDTVFGSIVFPSFE